MIKWSITSEWFNWGDTQVNPFENASIHEQSFWCSLILCGIRQNCANWPQIEYSGSPKLWLFPANIRYVITPVNVITVNQQILACYYIWRIWRIACFRQYLSPPTYTSIVHCIDGPRRDAKFNSSQINVNRFILRNAKFYSRQNLLIYSNGYPVCFSKELVLVCFFAGGFYSAAKGRFFICRKN